MHLLTRKQGQSIIIRPKKERLNSESLGHIFNNGPIEVAVENIAQNSVQIRIDAGENLDVIATDLPSFPEAFIAGVVNEHSGAVLAKNVFNLRIGQHMSLRTLSEIAEIPFYTLCAIERGLGVVSLDELDRLAEALGEDVSILLSQNDVNSAD